MNGKEYRFNRPVKVLQIFTKVQTFGKAEKNHEARQQMRHWDPVASKAGYVEEGKLFLSESILQQQSFGNSDLITLEDLQSWSLDGGKEEVTQRHLNRCLNLHHPSSLGVFRLVPAGQLELHLAYDYFSIGLPERADFKICELKTHQPVEIKINGKLDHTLTGRMERTYKEQVYALELLGEFDSCQILPEDKISANKQLPQGLKTVDLLKPLW